MIAGLPKPLRWIVAMAIPLAASVVLVVFDARLPFGNDTVGAMLRGLVIGAITVAAIRFMRLGKWDKQKTDDA